MYRSFSKASKPWCCGGASSDLNPNVSVFRSLFSSLLCSKKSVFHLILLIKLSSLLIKLFLYVALLADVNSIRSSPNMLISADKTNNLYEISTENYNKLLLDNVTKSYKKAPQTLESNINKEAKKIATDLNLAERIQKFTEKKRFLCFKRP